MTYGYSRPVMRAMEADSGAALLAARDEPAPASRLRVSVEDIERDGLNISDRIYMTLDGYTPATMAKSLGVFLLSVTDALVRLRPTLLLVLGDRGEH